MAISIAWLLDELGNKLFAWSTTKAVMDYDRGGENGQTLQKTLKDIESSSGDMKKDIFATNGKPGVVDKAQYAENGINIYTHSKEGTVHNFQGEGSNGKALLTANFDKGDTITINGLPVTAYMGSEEAISSMVGSEWNGKWITFIFDGETLNFKGGGELSAADKANLIPENIRDGVKLFEGTSKEIVGNLIPFDELDVLACTASIYRTGPSELSYWNGTTMAYAFASNPVTISGTPIIAIMTLNSGIACDICGLSSVGQKTEGLTNRIWVTDSFIDGKVISYVVLGKR